MKKSSVSEKPGYGKGLIILAVLVILILAVVFINRYQKNKQFQAEETARAEQAEKELEAAKAEDPVKEEVKSSGTPTILVSNAEGAPGETVEVTVEILNNPGILGTSMALFYDEEVLQLNNAENGEAFADVLDMSNTKELSSGCIFLWDGESISEEEIKDGVILTLTFEIKEDAPAGKNQINLVFDKDGTADNDLNVIELSVEGGAVTVCSE